MIALYAAHPDQYPPCPMRQRPLQNEPRGNLPSEVGGFVGRGAELTELGRLLGASRLVTVTGVGGVGKSRLVLAAARAAAESDQDAGAAAQERYCDGVWLAELAAVREPALLELTLAEALGLTDHTTRPPRTVLAEHLAGRRLLLILDGFEQLVDETAELVRDLLRRSPGCGCSRRAAGRCPWTGSWPSRWPRPPRRRRWPCSWRGPAPRIRASQ